ncbi:transporter substrate-binding domain-containing protein [Stella sp.]|uniref:transporter substrate-binding domain-containing protein n=1 Tax=Stella sp. TaxID=2912054 RepID=UPI0035AE4869
MPFRFRRAAPLLAALAGLLAMAATAAAQVLPPVPDAIRRQGLLRAGVKCDYPPDGFMDRTGRPVGIEIELARQIAAYAFGRPDQIDMVCVSAANRIPSLVGGKIDLILATLGVSEERARVIDFGAPYAWGHSDVLVPQASAVRRLDDLAGRTVIVLKGAWQIGWFEKNLPQAKLLRLDTVSDGLQALIQGRGEGYAHDLAVLQGIARKNPRVRLLGEPYQLGHRAIGLRQGEAEWKAFLDAAVLRAKREGVVAEAVRRFVEPEQVQAVLDTWDLDRAPATSR